MSDILATARSAREALAKGLNALQADPNAPQSFLAAAEPIAMAMGALHRIERSAGAELATAAPQALDAVRSALGMLQVHSSGDARMMEVLEMVAGSLGMVFSLTKAAKYGPPPQPQAAPAPQPQAQPYAPPPAVQAQVQQPQAPAYAPQQQPAAMQQPAPYQQPQPQYQQPAPVFQPQPAAQPQYQQPQYQQAAPAFQPQPAPQAQPQAQYQQPQAQYQQPQAQPQPQPQYQQPQAQPQPQYQQPQAQPQPQAQYQQPQPPAFQPQPVAQQPAPQQGLGVQRDPFAAPQPAHQAPPWAAGPGAPVASMPQPVMSQHPPTPDEVKNAKLPLVEAELGTHSVTNFYKGLSGNDVVDHGGLFISTYNIPQIGQSLKLRVSMPGGYEFEAIGVVRWTREARESMASDISPPGFGVQFTTISPEARNLVHRYVRNREPMFHDDL